MAARKRIKWVRWVVVLAILGAAGYGIQKYRSRQTENQIEYRTGVVSRGDITQSVTANGQISAVRNVQVGSQISGTIKEIKVDFNDRVKEGDIIAQIDPSTYERNVDEAEAQIISAKAALKLAEVNLKRARELATSKLLPEADLDQAQATFDQAQAMLRIREAALKRAQVDLERTTIYAPISGVVISRNIEVGQTVAASFNTPTLFVIANDLARMQIEAAVSEADVGGVAEDQTVEFTVDAYPSRQFHGKVKQVRFAPSTNQNVVTYTTIIDVNNDDLKLRPGMTANASIVTAQKTNVLRVPNAALRFRPPEGAVVIGATNLPSGPGPFAMGGSTGRPPEGGTTSGRGALVEGGGSGRGPGGFGGPGEGGGSPGNREDMRKRFESMSPEEREQMREKFRAAGGFGGMGGPGGGGRRRDAAATRVVYTPASTNNVSKAIESLRGETVRTGVADSSFTEVLDGLSEGAVVITGSVAPRDTAPARPPGSPFGGMGMRPR